MRKAISKIYVLKLTTGASSGAATAYPSRAPEFTRVFCGVHVARALVFYVVFYRSLFVFFILSVFLYTASDYSFGMFKLFLKNSNNS